MNTTPSVTEAIRGVHFAPSDRIQAIRWADRMASNGVRAEFYTDHQALPETFEVYGSVDEDDPDPITAAAEIEWLVWRDFAGFNVAECAPTPRSGLPRWRVPWRTSVQ